MNLPPVESSLSSSQLWSLSVFATSNWSSICLLIATWAAMIFLLWLIKIHLLHSQSFHLQNLLCPFKMVRTPWCLHRAQSGVFFGDRSDDRCSIDMIKILLQDCVGIGFKKGWKVWFKLEGLCLNPSGRQALKNANVTLLTKKLLRSVIKGQGHKATKVQAPKRARNCATISRQMFLRVRINRDKGPRKF